MTSILTAFVLGSRDHKEHDRIYSIYTRERGKLGVMAKGTRKFESKLGPHMTPFTEVQLMVAHGRAWLKLASVERKRDYSRIREDLSLYGLGLGLNELMIRSVAEGEKDVGLYDFMIDAYKWIYTLPELDSSRLRFIQSALTLKWLVHIGFGPHCDACVSCQKEHFEIRKPHISVSHGGLVCGTCVSTSRSRFSDSRDISDELLAALRFVTVSPFEVLLTDKLDAMLSHLVEIQDEFVYYHLDKDLRVPVFINHLTNI